MINKILNSILGLIGLKIIKKTSSIYSGGASGYISAVETVKNAKTNNLSICDYIEKQWNQVGATQQVIDNMEKYSAFAITNPAVCEIGAGTGRYMEKIIAKCEPSTYESYETAQDWEEWLAKKYPIVTRKPDGSSLQSTDDKSIDLVHAHGVFVYLKFLDNIRYFNEMMRVTKPKGYIVFDCYTEDCMTPDIVDNWLQSKHNFPTLLPEKYIVDIFKNNHCTLIGTFFNSHGQGKSKYFVFKK